MSSSTCNSVASCVAQLLPSLVFVKLQCPEQASRAEEMAAHLLARGDDVCTNSTLYAGAEAAFEPGGVLHELARCAAQATAFPQEYLGYVSWPPIAHLACGPPAEWRRPLPPSSSSPPLPLSASARLGWVLAAAYAIALGASFLLAAVVATGRQPRPAGRGLRLVAGVAWVGVLALASAIAMTTAPPSAPSSCSSDLFGFFYRDEVTACVFALDAQVPDADVLNRMVSLVVPAGRARAVYERVRSLRAGGRNRTLRSVCGHCALTSFLASGRAGLSEHLVLGSALPDGVDADEPAIVNLLVPHFTPREWRQALARAITREMRTRWASDAATVAFAMREQANADVDASMRAEPHVVALSVGMLGATLYLSMLHFLRGRKKEAGGVWWRAMAASVGVMACVASAVGVARVIAGRALLLPASPYSVVVAPLVLGTGIDASLILLHTFRRSRSFAFAWPSILASSATTLLSFGAGLFLSVPHIRAFFGEAMLAVATSTALQVVAFPPMLRRLVPRPPVRRHPRVSARAGAGAKQPPPSQPGEEAPAPAKEGEAADDDNEEASDDEAAAPRDAPRTTRLYWRPALAALTIVWISLLPTAHWIDTSFDLTQQIGADTMTRRFLDASRVVPQARTAPVYVLVRGVETANWTDVRARMRDADLEVGVDWRASYEGSRATSVAEWRSTPLARVAYAPFLGAEHDASVIVTTRPAAKGDADEDEEGDEDGESTADAARAMREWHARGSEGVCFADVERVGPYTVDTVFRKLWLLALVACVASTAVGALIAGWHGMASFVALALSYVTTLGIVSALHVRVHMALIAAFLVAPGFLVDFTLHVSYHPDAVAAVLLSGLTSVAGIAPYVLTQLPGIHDFAIVFTSFIVIGLLHAFAASVTRAGQYEAV